MRTAGWGHSVAEGLTAGNGTEVRSSATRNRTQAVCVLGVCAVGVGTREGAGHGREHPEHHVTVACSLRTSRWASLRPPSPSPPPYATVFHDAAPSTMATLPVKTLLLAAAAGVALLWAPALVGKEQAVASSLCVVRPGGSLAVALASPSAPLPFFHEGSAPSPLRGDNGAAPVSARAPGGLMASATASDAPRPPPASASATDSDQSPQLRMPPSAAASATTQPPSPAASHNSSLLSSGHASLSSTSSPTEIPSSSLAAARQPESTQAREAWRPSSETARIQILRFRDGQMDGGVLHSTFPVSADQPEVVSAPFSARPHFHNSTFMRSHGLLAQPMVMFSDRYLYSDREDQWAFTTQGATTHTRINPFAQLLSITSCTEDHPFCNRDVAASSLDRDTFLESQAHHLRGLVETDPFDWNMSVVKPRLIFAGVTGLVVTAFNVVVTSIGIGLSIKSPLAVHPGVGAAAPSRLRGVMCAVPDTTNVSEPLIEVDEVIVLTQRWGYAVFHFFAENLSKVIALRGKSLGTSTRGCCSVRPC